MEQQLLYIKMIFWLLGVLLIASGVIALTHKKAKISQDLMVVLTLGFFTSALKRVFVKARAREITRQEINFFAGFFLVVGFACTFLATILK